MALLFSVRKYQEEDKEQCRSLWRELTEWHREIYQDPSIGGDHPEDYFDKHLARVGPDQLWVAVRDSEVVGLIGLIIDDREFEIEPVVVCKRYRRRGIGARLLETVIAEARKRGAVYLDVKPVARNESTVKFLHKLGFKSVGHIDLFMDFGSHVWKHGLKVHGCKFDY